METIFKDLSMDRKTIKWEDYLFEMTPVEQINGTFFKREDKFAPLGYGGINGSKLRQCIWLVNDYVNNSVDPIGIISGTSVKSPQLPMGSAVAEHYGLKSLHVIGATKPEIAHKHENVAMATWFGAEFYVNKKIAYNPVLQRKVKQIMSEDKEKSKYFYLEYGITVDHTEPWNTKEKIERFHFVGSEQVKNIPEEVETLIIPAGSCNSCTSILYGISRFKPKNLKNVYLIGIGPNKIDFIEERLNIIEEVSDIPMKRFRRYYHDSSKKQEKYDNNLEHFMELDKDDDYSFNLHHFDLHTTKYVDYQDEMPYNYGKVEFHPTYEGKVMTYVMEKMPELFGQKTMFWIVGSKPYKENMWNLLTSQLGEYPTQINEFNYEKNYHTDYDFPVSLV